MGIGLYPSTGAQHWSACPPEEGRQEAGIDLLLGEEQLTSNPC